MPLLEKPAECHLKRCDRKNASFCEDPEVLAGLEKVRGDIERALTDSEYFHGTGRKHYGFKGDSQYEGIDHDVVVDRLGSLVTNGLVPQTDLFADSFTGDEEAKTVSLSKSRMYSRFYADLHMNENDGYRYEYGSQAFWWSYMLYLMIITGLHDKDEWKSQMALKRSRGKLAWNKLLDRTKNLAVKGQNIPVLAYVVNAYLFLLQHLYFKSDPLWKIPNKNLNPIPWMGRFRKDCGGVGEKQPGWRKAMLYNGFAGSGRSDIEGNYGMVIGIKKGKVKKKEITRKAVSSFETRCQNPLGTDSWTYVEVPMAVVVKTREDLNKLYQEAGLGEPEIPVFATEHVEMLMREKSLAELAEKDE